MSDTLTAYLISVTLLAALALFVPCLDSLVRALRGRADKDNAAQSRATANKRGREAV